MSDAERSRDEQQCLEGLEDDRTIFRRPKDREHPYVMVAKAVVFDNRVSHAARCVLIAMLSMPDDWNFNVRHLADVLDTSKSSIARWIQELTEAGYVVRDQNRRRGGEFSSARYLVFEHPTPPDSTVSQNTVHGPTVHGGTGHGEMGHTDTPDPETKDKETEEEPPPPSVSAPEPERQEARLPEHMQLAAAWYREFAKRTARTIMPSGEDFVAAKAAIGRSDLATLTKLITPYFTGDWWFTKNKATKKSTYSFAAFLKHFPEMLEAAPAKGPAPPRVERRCQACNQVLTFGTGRFTRCRCGKAWEIGDGGELEDVSREGV